MDILDLLSYTSIVSSFISFLIGLYLFNKSGNKYVPALVFYLLLTFLSDLGLRILGSLGIHNSFIYQIYTIGACAFLTWMYFHIFPLRSVKMVLIAVCISILAIQFIVILENGLYAIDSTAYLLLSIGGVAISMYYYYYIFDKPITERIMNTPLFWINGAFLFYFGSTIFLSLFEEYISSNGVRLISLLWPIQIIATIILNILISIGLYKEVKLSKGSYPFRKK